MKRLLYVFAILLFSFQTYSANHYERRSGVAGKVVAVGSDTMANMMLLWAEEFEKIYPQANIEIDVTGSSTAPPALAEGVANIGVMSRAMKDSEIRRFEKNYGYPPTVLRVAIDAIAIFVEESNPLNGLTLKQIDGIFSSTHYCGGRENIAKWAQLGVNFSQPHTPMQLFGRNSISGTHASFKLNALCDGDFKNTVNEQPGSASVVFSVASHQGAIGYAPVGYKMAGAKVLSVGTDADSLIPLNPDTVSSGRYPFSRYLYLIVNKSPSQPFRSVEIEFLKFVLSKEGQDMVAKDGYFAVSEAIVNRQLNLLAN